MKNLVEMAVLLAVIALLLCWLYNNDEKKAKARAMASLQQNDREEACWHRLTAAGWPGLKTRNWVYSIDGLEDSPVRIIKACRRSDNIPADQLVPSAKLRK